VKSVQVLLVRLHRKTLTAAGRKVTCREYCQSEPYHEA